MIPLILTISFIIHFITVYVVIILYQKLKLSESPQDPKEFEQMFEQYLDQIRDENKKLQQLALQNSENQPFHTEKEKKETIPSETDAYEPIESPYEVKDELETSRTSNILSLAEKGYSPTEIAKKLSCGKTEAELIIKFYTKKAHKG